MTDILIRGVEMPNSCEKCPFNDYEQGFCFAAWKFNESGWPDFSLNVGCQETRNHRCPLVPLPEGHGRLGDLDALTKTICNSCDGQCEVVQCDCLNCKADCRCDIVKEISEAHTVVPAEGGTDNG